MVTDSGSFPSFGVSILILQLIVALVDITVDPEVVKISCLDEMRTQFVKT